MKTMNLYFIKFFVFLFILVIQLKGLSTLGTYWDDAGYIETIPIIYEKVSLFFTDYNNPYLGNFNYNLEFYGYLFPIIVDIFSNFGVVQLLVKTFLENLYFYEIINSIDLDTITRFFVFNSIIILIIYQLIKFNKKVYGYFYTVIFTLLLFLIPSFYGHLFFNIKDIPFSIIFFFLSIYLFDKSENLFKKSNHNLKFLLIVSLGFSSLLLIRISAIIFIGFLCLNIYLFNLDKFQNDNNLSKYFTNLILIFSISSIITFIFTPSAWRYPKMWLIRAIETQFLLSDWSGEVLTNGKSLDAQNLPGSYLIEWFIYKLPINIIFLFVIGTIYILFNKSKFDNFTKYSIFFVITIFSFFSISQPLAYDGIRQYLFLIPFFVHIASIFLSELLNYEKIKLVSIGAITISIIYMFSSQSSLYPFNYVYFNELVDEERITYSCQDMNGCGEWETDYWGLSGKSLILDSMEQIDLKTQLLFCRPEQVFSNYIDEISNDKDFEKFYVASINRPSKNNSICKSINLNGFTCELINKKSIDLRGSEIDLSYLHYCS